MKANNIRDYEFRSDYEKLGLEIVKIQYFNERHPESERTIPHRLKFYALIFITEGKGTHYIDFAPYSFSVGSLLFISKNQIHAWSNNNKAKGYIIFFTEPFLFRNQIQFNDLSYSYPYNYNLYSPILQTKKKGGNFEIFSHFFKLIHEEYDSSSVKIQEELLQCLLRVLILKIQDATPTLSEDANSESNDLFIEFQKQLDQNISLTRNALDYCQMLNVTYYQLNKIVKALTNKTVKAFIDNFLMLQAKRLLADPSTNASQVSYSLGFEDPTNFSKFFKKHAEISPKLFSERLTR